LTWNSGSVQSNLNFANQHLIPSLSLCQELLFFATCTLSIAMSTILDQSSMHFVGIKQNLFSSSPNLLFGLWNHPTTGPTKNYV